MSENMGNFKSDQRYRLQPLYVVGRLRDYVTSAQSPLDGGGIVKRFGKFSKN